MNGYRPALPPAIGRVSTDGLFLDAEPRLAELNRRAGGTPGAPIAIPPIAALVRLTAQLDIPLTRAIVAADMDDDLDLWVRTEPDALGIRIEVGGWSANLPWQGNAGPRDATDFLADADWTWSTDASLHLTHVSERASRALGFDPETVLGQPLSRLFVLSNDSEGGVPLLAALAEQMQFDNQEAAIRGTPYRVRLAAVPRCDPAGGFDGFDGAAYTVDDARPVGDATTRSDEISESFGRRIGQALRDPLARIIANADSISAQTDGALGNDYATYATDIGNAGRHLLGLVGDLEDLQAIERADFTVATEELDLVDLARRAAGLLAVRAAQGQVQVDRPPADDHMPARGEFRRVLQILVNLVGNAVRYSPPGASLWIRAQRDGSDACVIVADQGPGIASEDHERIFEKFARVDPTEAGGSGLGLYIARRLARAMGGDILVDSAPGEGARFVLRLPASSAD